MFLVPDTNPNTCGWFPSPSDSDLRASLDKHGDRLGVSFLCLSNSSTFCRSWKSPCYFFSEVSYFAKPASSPASLQLWPSALNLLSKHCCIEIIPSSALSSLKVSWVALLGYSKGLHGCLLNKGVSCFRFGLCFSSEPLYLHLDVALRFIQGFPFKDPFSTSYQLQPWAYGPGQFIRGLTLNLWEKYDRHSHLSVLWG